MRTKAYWQRRLTLNAFNELGMSVFFSSFSRVTRLNIDVVVSKPKSSAFQTVGRESERRVETYSSIAA